MNSIKSLLYRSRSPATLKKAMRRIFVFSRPYRFRLYLAIAFTIISSLVWLALPLGLRSLLDAVFEEGNRELLNLITWGLLALFVLQTVFGFWGRYYLEWIGESGFTIDRLVQLPVSEKIRQFLTPESYRRVKGRYQIVVFRVRKDDTSVSVAAPA